MKGLLFSSLVLCAAMAQSAPEAAEQHTEQGQSLYDPTRDAAADVEVALARAKRTAKRVVLAMGANWCHDSKSLAARFESPRFRAMMASRYELVYIDVGTPQTGHGRNLEIANRFGLKHIRGTPTVFILSPEGRLLNRRNAPSWRHASQRSDDAIFTFFERFGE
jgi:thiol:disulfide interchange protein